ncbi:PilZ domain-containing protein [Bradyrhizobium sp.]|jgi:PilZ domain|uniref:PilZ domain-containing protein n=1 Tax=Bradyrhizobium sp. TaxID=376 RepID=UPI003C728591
MERRATSRQWVLRAGTIEFDGRSIDCVVRNISATGAAFDLSSPIPNKVTLNFVTSHERQNCNVVWRQQRRVGVTFN